MPAYFNKMQWITAALIIGILFFLPCSVLLSQTGNDNLPPLIDREIFFGDPEIAGAQISPDGRFISFRKPYNNVMNIWVKGIEEPFEHARPITADTTRPIPGYFWSEDGKYILYVQDKGGDENYHIYAVDPTALPTEGTTVPKSRNLTPIDNVRAAIYAVPETTPDVIIIGLNDRDPQVHDVYSLNLVTGELKLLIQNDANIASWVVDRTGTIRLAMRQTSDGGTEFLTVDNSIFTPVYSVNNEETAYPIYFHEDGRHVYFVTNKGADRNLISLILFDPETGNEQMLESDPEGQVDISSTFFSRVTRELMATSYVGDRLRVYPKTEKFAEAYRSLQDALPDGDIYLGSSTNDETLQLVSVTSDVDPGATYLFNSETGEVTFLYRPRPNLPTEHMAPMKPVRYTARDGLEIPAYLTLPKGLEPSQLPVVILPHGGPWARDAWGYDPYAQFLANRGYAVLQPNFRGSTGYGKRFLNAGNKEWGTGAMQHDISDGVKYLIDGGIADPNRIAIFGGSYGGYATLAGLAFTPDLYAAGISYVGPSNIITLLNSIPPYWAPVRKIFSVRVGDPDKPEDKERLIKQSPLFSAQNITAPLLVVQGANDPRVKKAESDQIVVALRDLGRNVEYIVAPDEGHGFAGRENRIALTVAIEKFFAEHLKGRYQTEVPADIRQRLTDMTVDIRTVTVPASVDVPADIQKSPLPVGSSDRIRNEALDYRMRIQTSGQEFDLTTSRTVSRTLFNGTEVIKIVEYSSGPIGTASDTVYIDPVTLLPIYRSVLQGMASVTIHYSPEKIWGEINMGAQTIPISVELEAPAFGDGVALDIALMSLPLGEGYEATFRSFNVNSQKSRPMKLTVAGSEQVTVPAGEFNAYKIEVRPLDGDDGEKVLWVSTDDARKVLKVIDHLPATMGGGNVTTEFTGSH
jgi:dipeptidyl aminopeptidase/acylaminoacyl peptidase